MLNSLGNHLVDDWAIEWSGVSNSGDLSSGDRLKLRGLFRPRASAKYLWLRPLRSQQYALFTKLPWTPILLKCSLFQYAVTKFNCQPKKSSINDDFPLECKHLKGGNLLYKTICRYSRASAKKIENFAYKKLPQDSFKSSYHPEVAWPSRTLREEQSVPIMVRMTWDGTGRRKEVTQSWFPRELGVENWHEKLKE